MKEDPEEYRVRVREAWDGAAGGWERRREAFQAGAAPVSAWMVEHIDPRPGQTVLELAAGPGDTGLLAAPLLEPGGKLISTDGSEAMVAVAERRAKDLGIANAEFRAMEGEWIDLEAASVDGVLCRWGFMLMVDPEAALRETRRVLRSGGRMALAAWDEARHNPHMTCAFALLGELGLVPPPDPDAPGPFSFAEPGRIEGLLADAGFEDIEVQALDLRFRFASADAVFETFADMSPNGGATLRALSPADHTRFRDALDERVAPLVGADGAVELPGRALVAAAGA